MDGKEVIIIRQINFKGLYRTTYGKGRHFNINAISGHGETNFSNYSDSGSESNQKS